MAELVSGFHYECYFIVVQMYVSVAMATPTYFGYEKSALLFYVFTRGGGVPFNLTRLQKKLCPEFKQYN